MVDIRDVYRINKIYLIRHVVNDIIDKHISNGILKLIQAGNNNKFSIIIISRIFISLSSRIFFRSNLKNI